MARHTNTTATCRWWSTGRAGRKGRNGSRWPRYWSRRYWRIILASGRRGTRFRNGRGTLQSNDVFNFGPGDFHRNHDWYLRLPGTSAFEGQCTRLLLGRLDEGFLQGFE